jgi:hypothetical protein
LNLNRTPSLALIADAAATLALTAPAFAHGGAGGGDGYGLSPSTTEAIVQVTDYLSRVH